MVRVNLDDRRAAVLRAVEFIEQRLDRDVSLSDVAAAAGLSVYHFSRVFKGTVGDSVAAYIRKRRLTLAAERLAESGTPVMSAALDSGFESHEAFTRAFHKVFERPPADVKRSGIPPRMQVRSRPQLTPALLEHLTERISMEPEIRARSRFAVVGISRNFNPRVPNARAQLVTVYPELQSRLGEIGNRVGGHRFQFVDAFPNEPPDRIFNFAACVEVADLERMPEGMVGRWIDEQQYAVFTHKGQGSEIYKTVEYALGSWLPKSGRKLPEGAPSFELYDERYSGGPDSVCELWLPVSRQ
jgi:AraC family transcriptional regulator